MKLAAFRHGLNRVEAEVQEHLLGEIGIGVDQRHVLGPVAEQLHLGIPELKLQQVERLPEHLPQVAGLGACRRRTREHEQAGDDLLDPVQLLDDVVQVLAARVVGLELGAHELDRGPDPGERVADLVGDVGRELAE